MTDISSMTDEELQKIAAGPSEPKGSDISSMSDEELRKIAGPTKSDAPPGGLLGETFDDFSSAMSDAVPLSGYAQKAGTAAAAGLTKASNFISDLLPGETGSILPGLKATKNKTYSELYDMYQDQYEKEKKARAERSPYASMAGTITGSLAVPAKLMQVGLAPAAGRVALSAADAAGRGDLEHAVENAKDTAKIATAVELLVPFAGKLFTQRAASTAKSIAGKEASALLGSDKIIETLPKSLSRKAGAAAVADEVAKQISSLKQTLTTMAEDNPAAKAKLLSAVESLRAPESKFVKAFESATREMAEGQKWTLLEKLLGFFSITNPKVLIALGLKTLERTPIAAKAENAIGNALLKDKTGAAIKILTEKATQQKDKKGEK